MKYSDFQEPKPPRLPLMITPMPDKLSELSKVDSSFNDVLADNLDTQQDTTKNTTTTKSQKIAVAHSTLQTSIIQQGIKHIEHAKIAQIEQLGQKNNSERVGEKNYINYAAAFQAGLSSSTVDDIKRKKKEYEEIPIDEDEDEENPAKGLSYTHNLSLYKKISEFNPFKKQDTVNYNLFKNSPMFDLANKSFMSPLRLLDKSVFDETKSSLEAIEKKSPTVQNLEDLYKDNNVSEIDVNSNYHNIEKVKNNDEYLWSSWDDKKSFHYVINRYNDIQKYSNIIRQFGGNFKDQEVHLQRIKSLEADISKQNTELTKIVEEMDSLLKDLLLEINSNTQLMIDPGQLEKFKANLDSIEEMMSLIEPKLSTLPQNQTNTLYFHYNQLKTQTQNNSLSKQELQDYFENKSTLMAKNWWETIGKKIEQEGMLIPFALMAESAYTIFDESKLSLNENDTSLEHKLLHDYKSHLNSTVFKSKAINTPVVKPADFMMENLNYGKRVYDKLVSLDLIHPNGTIENFDPDSMNLKLNLDSPAEDTRVRRILKSKIKGENSFDHFDSTKFNDYFREDIYITDPHGTKHDISTLLGPISGNSSEEIYSNSLKKYNILFDMLESMTGNKQNLGKDLTYNYEIVDEKINISVYPNSEWVQYNPQIPVVNSQTDEIEYVAGWEKIEDAPLVMQFNNKNSADTFFKSVVDSILQLEPVLATFSDSLSSDNEANLHYKNNEAQITALRVLTDNEGYHSQQGIITSTSNTFNYQIDHVANKEFFQTAHWTEISNYTKSKVIFEIGKKIFAKSIVNRINKSNHKNKTEEYNQRKKEWEEKEYNRKIEEKKSENKNKARRKSIIQLAEKKSQKRKAEMQKELKRIEAEKKKREVERKNQTKKAESKKKK